MDILPENKIPMITIQEIDNTEYEKMSTAEGEQVSLLTYQIDCYAKSTLENQVSSAIRELVFEVDSVLGGKDYKLKRIGSPVYIPHDNATGRGILRYTCAFDLNTNIIYKN